VFEGLFILFDFFSIRGVVVLRMEDFTWCMSLEYHYELRFSVNCLLELVPIAQQWHLPVMNPITNEDKKCRDKWVVTSRSLCMFVAASVEVTTIRTHILVIRLGNGKRKSRECQYRRRIRVGRKLRMAKIAIIMHE
jgi:hypothetical protein